MKKKTKKRFRVKRRDPLDSAKKRARKKAKQYRNLPKGHALRNDMAKQIKAIRNV